MTLNHKQTKKCVYDQIQCKYDKIVCLYHDRI